MFRFDDKKEERRLREKQLMKEVHMTEKPKFKDLVSIMFAQYLIIFPMAIIGMIVFILIAKFILYMWGA